MSLRSSDIAEAAPTSRERLHDLRGLLAVITSGSHMLGDSIAPDQRARIVEAIQDAAIRGSGIASELLATSFKPAPEERCELGTRIAKLRPLLQTLAGKRAMLRIDASVPPTFIRCRPARFDHILLELVSNARVATMEAGTITLRARRIGMRVWIFVADTGRGIAREELRRLLGSLHELPVGPHGGGVRQLRCFAREADARLRISSRPGSGTVVALALPVLPPDPAAPNS